MRLPIDLNNQVRVTTLFGAEPNTYKQFNLAGHHGYDIAAPIGTPVYAPENGIITVSSNQARDQYTGRIVAGETIVLKGARNEHWLMHLSRRQVSPGQQVSENEIIGYSGNTGYSTGPHLHWGTRPDQPDINNGYRGFVDPMQVLASTVSGVPMPVIPSGNSVTLPAHVPSWAVYREGTAFRKGTTDQVGTLLPAKYGGLTYDIIGWISNNAVIINTKSYGRVALWVKDTDAIIRNVTPPAPAPVVTPPVYTAPSAPINISSPKYQAIVKDIPGYISGPNALNRINPVTTVKAGSDYYVFTNKYGMDNVTLISGQPGAWINPSDNVPDPPPPVIVPVEEPKRTQDDIKKDWVLPPQEPVIVLPTPPLPTPTPEPETPDYQQVYHPFGKAVWYKAVKDTFVQDMTTNDLIGLSKDRELPIHGTFVKDLVLYGRATKKGSEAWYGVPLNDLNLALTPQQKLEKVANTVMTEPVFIDSTRPTFDRISHSIHTTDLIIDKVMDIFRVRVKKKK